MKVDAKKLLDKLRVFDHIVGQAQAKRTFETYINSYYHTRIFPNLMANAPKGMGKTVMMEAIGSSLFVLDEKGAVVTETDPQTGIVYPKRKRFWPYSGPSIKNLKQFINSVLLRYIVNKDVILFIDEAGELPRDVTQFLLLVLNPNKEYRNTVHHEEFVFDFDFRRQTFLFATSEPQRIFHSLMDRLTRIDLEEYTMSEMAQIVQKTADKITFKDNVLEEVATVLRGNARQAVSMVQNIEIFLAERKIFGRKEWEDMKGVFGIKPLGLNPSEILVLKFLNQRGQGTSLQQLAAKTGLSREALQRGYEPYLLKHSLMEITTNGRELSAFGREYLRNLENPKIKQFKSNLVAA